ncbi:MAG TPA: LLM class flavin-dependent oxidoreductase [Microlunatus sp.]
MEARPGADHPRPPVRRPADGRRRARRPARTGVRRLRRGERSTRAGGQAVDEGLDVLQGLWTGRPFSYVGRHHRVSDAELLPAPAQRHVPIWVGGEWPDHRAPFRRAARYDGVAPLLFSVPEAQQPAAIGDLVSSIRGERGDAGRFEALFGAETLGDGSIGGR